MGTFIGETIVGNPDFDYKITSRTTGEDQTITAGDASADNPFEEGKGLRVTDINFPVGQFSFTGSREYGVLVPDGFGGETLVAEGDCYAGWSQNGVDEWFGQGPFRQDGPSEFFCSVRGQAESGEPCIFVGGLKFQRISQVIPFNRAVPMCAVSFDDAKSWEEVSGLEDRPETQDGFISAVGYDPKTKLFWASASYNYFSGPNIVTDVATYSGQAGGISLVEQGPAIIAGSPYPTPNYPKKLKFCGNFTRSDLRYVCLRIAGQSMSVTTDAGKRLTVAIGGTNLTIDGNSVSTPFDSDGELDSACAKSNLIVISGSHDNSGPYLYSSNDGENWTPIAIDGVSPRPDHSGSTVSFS